MWPDFLGVPDVSLLSKRPREQVDRSEDHDLHQYEADDKLGEVLLDLSLLCLGVWWVHDYLLVVPH